MPPVTATVVSLLALVVAIVALVLATVANRRWMAGLRSPEGPGDAATESSQLPGAQALAPLAAGLEALERELGQLRSQVDAQQGEVAALRGPESTPSPADPTALRHVALVRYDAFADVGGRLSYSLAVLDDTASGLVLTTLSGKSDVRTYVRTISGGRAEGTLTEEERQAIEAAVGRDA